MQYETGWDSTSQEPDEGTDYENGNTLPPPLELAVPPLERLSYPGLDVDEDEDSPPPLEYAPPPNSRRQDPDDAMTMEIDDPLFTTGTFRFTLR